MFAIAFDMRVADIEVAHPSGYQAAYADIARTLTQYGFRRIQGSVYVTDDVSMTNVFSAITALKRLPWFVQSVRDIRAFRVENWSDFTEYVQSGPVV